MIRERKVTLVFVNTRAQAELMFGALWRLNKDNLPIALHHGSLAVEQRRKVEAAMAAGALRAVVCTSSLDLGIDWGDIDLVVQVGAPKGAARLLQRIGRANHRLDEPSRPLLVPANRFEVLECIAAQDALAEHTLDGGALFPGGFDVLAQHVTGVACSGPFDADALYRRGPPGGTVRRADARRFRRRARASSPPAATRWRPTSATGGWSRGEDGLWRLSDPKLTRQYRMNIGTIVEAPVMRVRLGRGKVLGEVEEYFVSMLTPGDTFLFAGRLLAFEGIRQNEVIVTLAKSGRDPKVPAYAGGKLPLTHASGRPRAPPAGRSLDLAPAAAAGRRVAGGAGAALASSPRPTSSWSRPSPAVPATTWSPTASPAATRTRPWACC